MAQRAETQHYEIRVRGHPSETLLAAFPGLKARLSGGDTLLAGELSDQPALYGVLAQVEALGLELIEVRRSNAKCQGRHGSASSDDDSSSCTTGD
jgi:hypothetical protein